MNRKQSKLIKKILSDPLTMLIEERSDITKQQISALEQTWNEYLDLKKKHKSMQNQCKKLSRQIGEAKQNDTFVDELVESMKMQSSELNRLKNRLSDTTESILAYFELDDNHLKPVNGSTFASNRHSQSDRVYSNDDISISQLTDNQVAWNNYVESNLATSIYHRAEWQALIQNVFGHKGYYLQAHNNKHEIVGILPLVRLKSRLFGNFMVSMPFFNYGGAVADHPSIEQKLIHAANDLAMNLGVSHIEYRDDIAREGLPVKTEKLNMILSLPENQDQLWNSFTSKLRSQIRRPQREDTRIQRGREECLNDFYSVFAHNMRDLGTPVYGKSFFREILQCFAEQSNIIVIYLHNRPVAAAFLLGHRNTLEIPWASTLRCVNQLSMNMLLYWEVLKFAIENKYKNFDFGRSSKKSGTFRFKQQWGAKPKQLFWHYWLPENSELPQLNPNNPKYSLLIDIWKKLPLNVTKYIGPKIVKNLP